MIIYKRNNILPLVLSIIFVIGAIPYFLIRSYFMAGTLVVLGILWFAGYRISRRPYVIINKGKLIVSRGLMQPNEYQLSHLTITKTEKGYMQLTYKYQGVEEKVHILLSAMGMKAGQQFVQDLTRSLQENKGKGSSV